MIEDISPSSGLQSGTIPKVETGEPDVEKIRIQIIMRIIRSTQKRLVVVT